MSDAKVVLDTNIVSYLSKGAALAEAYAPHLQGRLLAVSFITVGEMYFGAEKDKWGEKKRRRLETLLRNFVVIPYDHEIARCYGRLLEERRSSGRRIETNDAWIAACTVRHGIPLVTHNRKDFEGITSLEIITENVKDAESSSE